MEKLDKAAKNGNPLGLAPDHLAAWRAQTKRMFVSPARMLPTQLKEPDLNNPRGSWLIFTDLMLCRTMTMRDFVLRAPGGHFDYFQIERLSIPDTLTATACAAFSGSLAGKRNQWYVIPYRHKRPKSLPGRTKGAFMPMTRRPGGYADAKEQGLPTYFGNECPACRSEVRLTLTGQCWNCKKSRAEEKKRRLDIIRAVAQKIGADKISKRARKILTQGAGCPELSTDISFSRDSYATYRLHELEHAAERKAAREVNKEIKSSFISNASPPLRAELRTHLMKGVNYGGENSYPLYDPPYNASDKPPNQFAGSYGSAAAMCADRA